MKGFRIWRLALLLTGATKKKASGRRKANKEVRGESNRVKPDNPETDRNKNDLKGTPGMRIVDPETNKQVGVFDESGKACVYDSDYIERRRKAVENK